MSRPPSGSKTSLRIHLEQVEKTTGKKPQMLQDQPKAPRDLLYIYHWYLELRLDSRLTYQELKAWSELSRRNIKAWEAELIISVDRVFWRTING